MSAIDSQTIHSTGCDSTRVATSRIGVEGRACGSVTELQTFENPELDLTSIFSIAGRHEQLGVFEPTDSQARPCSTLLQSRPSPSFDTTNTCTANAFPYYRAPSTGRGSQVVRQGSAKAPFVGSIPSPASNLFRRDLPHELGKQPRVRQSKSDMPTIYSWKSLPARNAEQAANTSMVKGRGTPTEAEP